MNAPPRYPVADLKISATTLAAATETILTWVDDGERTYVSVCTADTTVQSHDRPELAAMINAGGMATPDGMPLVWAGRLQGLPVSRVYGPDLMLAVCQAGLKSRVRHFLYGSTEQVLSDLQSALEARFPGLQVAGTYAPPYRPLEAGEADAVAGQINASGAEVVWVGLGTPKQDYWMAEFRPRLDASVLIAVGAAFDFHAGNLRQAPRWMMRMGMEWLFRLAVEPRRLWLRYLVGNPRFVWLWLRGVLRRRFGRS